MRETRWEPLAATSAGQRSPPLARLCQQLRAAWPAALVLGILASVAVAASIALAGRAAQPGHGPGAGASLQVRSVLSVQEPTASFAKIAYGAEGCPPGREIETESECRTALETLSLPTDPVWDVPLNEYPRFCSVRELVEPHMHWNEFATGQGRHDLAPVCRIASYEVGSPFFTGVWEGTANHYVGQMGISFFARRDFTIKALGAQSYVRKLERGVKVTLWSAETRQELASATVGPTSAAYDTGIYLFEALDSPVKIEAGKEYRVSRQCVDDPEDKWSNGYMEPDDLETMTSSDFAIFGKCWRSEWHGDEFPDHVHGDLRCPGIVNFDIESTTY